MPAIELFHGDGKSAGAWYCSECRVVNVNKEQAEYCHGKRLCECGRPSQDRHTNLCIDCANRQWRERIERDELARFEKADKIEAKDYTGEQVFLNDRYYETVEEAIETYLP